MQILIVGAGKLGYKLAEALSTADNSITVVDIDQQALDRMNSNLDVLTIKGNAVQSDVLAQVNLKKTDLAIAVTSSDETNMVFSVLAKKLGCHKTIARVRDPQYANQLDFLKKVMEIDYIINPELAVAKYIAKLLLRGTVVYIESFANGQVGMIDLPVKNIPQLIGKQLKEITIFDAILVVAVLREGQVLIPHGDTRIEDTDTIVLIGKQANLNHFVETYVQAGETRELKHVLILGGGKAGFYLAAQLQENGVEVKIIERDEQQCQYLAEHLKDVLVIHGDGTDSELLREENFGEMDALVSVTGNDEENLLVALLGKQQGIPHVIAKISRSNFIPIIEQLGIDRAVNPILISAGEIIRFIQGGQVASIFLLLDGQAEVVDLVVSEKALVVGRRLADLDLPKGIIIGAIARENQVIIPDGNSVILPNDRVVVFCLESETPVLNKLFYHHKGGFFHELWHSYQESRKHSQD